MTTLDLQFRIDASRAEIYVNSISAPLATPVGLAANVDFVSFSKGAGQIVYNDRPPIAELFSDPSPYQSYINQWITVLSQAAVKPLTLAQAQAVKCALVGAIAAVKRAAPVTVTVGGTPQPWDASDQALARMSALAGLVYIDDLNALISSDNSGEITGVNQLVSHINTLVGNLNIWATHFNTLDGNFGGLGAGIQTAINSIVANAQAGINQAISNISGAESGNVGGWNASITAVSVGAVTGPATTAATTDSSLATLTDNVASLSTFTVPTLQLLPVGATAAATVTPTDLKNIMLAIASQTTHANLISAQKQAAVNALTIMGDVIAYDATTGW